MANKWTTADMPSQEGKLALVTGANRGLGLEITAGLARAGATVVMGCRDADKARAAAEAVRRQVPAAKLETMTIDLANQSSIRRFAEAFSARFPRLHILCNNASAIMVPFQKTRDGFEMHIGTNHFGTFALTGLLLERLQATGGARIVNTSSMAHRMTAGIDFADINGERKPYKEMDAYGRSKLATLLFTFELARRLQKAGFDIIAAAAHPGWANTNPDKGSLPMRLSNAIFAQPVAMGALPALCAATADGVRNGDYFGPGGFQQLRGHPVRVDCSAEARDPVRTERLWTLSEQLTGVKYL